MTKGGSRSVGTGGDRQRSGPDDASRGAILKRCQPDFLNPEVSAEGCHHGRSIRLGQG